jgi:uncharacterized membrane protein YqaE (UPF0057 family)
MRSKMHEIYLPKRWWIALLLMSLFIGGAIWICWVITTPAVEALRLNKPLPEGWPWLNIVLFDMIFVSGAAYLCWKVLADFRISYTSEGIMKPGLFKNRFVRWNDILSVHVAHRIMGRAIYVELKTQGETLIINTLHYKRPEALISLIRNCTS